MKPLFLSLTLFALGCYAQQPVQYVPQQAAPQAPAPTIITVPQNQPQPPRPIIIQPFRGDHRDFRHGTNQPAPPAKPTTNNSTATLATFVSANVQLPREELVELPAAPRDVTTSQATIVDASQQQGVAQPTIQPVERKKPTLRARIKERVLQRIHRWQR